MVSMLKRLAYPFFHSNPVVESGTQIPRLTPLSRKELEETLVFPDALPDFGAELTPVVNSQMSRYLHSVPREDLHRVSVETFVHWLSEAETLGVEGELMSAISKPLSVELVAMQKRMQSARFEEMARRPVEWKKRILSSRTFVYLNPNHVWAAMQTNQQYQEQSQTRCEVLYYQTDGQVRTTAVDPELVPVLKQLGRGPIAARTFLRDLDLSHCTDWCNAVKEMLENRVITVS